MPRSSTSRCRRSAAIWTPASRSSSGWCSPTRSPSRRSTSSPGRWATATGAGSCSSLGRAGSRPPRRWRASRRRAGSWSRRASSRASQARSSRPTASPCCGPPTAPTAAGRWGCGRPGAASARCWGRPPVAFSSSTRRGGGSSLSTSPERRSANPLLPDRLIRARLFVVANLYTFLVYAALGGSTFYLALYLQSAAVGYSPSRASLVFLPISIVMFVLASRFGRLADRDGPRLYLTVAPLVMAAGLALLTVVTSTNPIVALPGVLVFAVGLACLVAPITSTALKASPDEYVGLAAGVNTTVSRIGGLRATPPLGVVITLVFAAQTSGGSGDPFATHGLTADQRAATIDSFRAGIGVAALLCIAGALLAARELPSGGGEGRPDAAPEPPPAPAP